MEKTDRGTTAVPVHVLIYELIYANTGNQNTAGVVISETKIGKYKLYSEFATSFTCMVLSPVAHVKQV
ncbi:MAG: hypothetical protein H0A75_04570 [Candidatus Methanofishera endochildressiae]|uniref:Uncharacterized protein n=1 Tax=Candidatus Methanofishera endochildressiae TaxID=2738884 RepID=A0A7Z0MNU3_9GAMM|nr:hypothetical protein [Candidatus Methanofishera endochildressiae]